MINITMDLLRRDDILLVPVLRPITNETVCVYIYTERLRDH